MEGNGTRMDYEDMFREITKKLYGEDPDHKTSSVQNEFEASVSYKNDEDTGNGTDGSDDGNWTYEDEPLKGTDGSRIAAYHAGKAVWRCEDCERLREHAERAAPPSRRTQETQTVPAALLPVTSSFLLQELPPAPAPLHLQQNTTTMPTPAAASTSGKRYNCPFCPYGTDRRDLYTRHENIHREEKPFNCYMCYKPFNRADHVKKHFMRMHRDHPYDVSKIRKPLGINTPKPPLQQDLSVTPATVNVSNQQQPQQQHMSNQFGFANNKGYQLQPNVATSIASTGTTGIHQAIIMPSPTGLVQSDANNCNTGRRVQNGGCNSKSHLKGGSKSTQERRYSCGFCPWTGVDNWCLKRHLNTHTKPYACSLCEYKAARSERLTTHVLKVHNRRQCSRCSFLGEDTEQLQMHQVHAHRASMPSTTTTQNASPPSNRHQQPLHPVGGGRPPPGPPVFPAPAAPTIAPATPVIPPSTLLGYQIPSPSVVPRSNETLENSLSSQISESRPNEKENQKIRRARKQSQPRPVRQAKNVQADVSSSNSQHVRTTNFEIYKIIQSRIRSASKKLLKCYLCPKYAPARGKTHRPYHTRASLTLHVLWRHKRGSWPAKSRAIRNNLVSALSSVTLKATFFTNSNFKYDR
ncbi:PREDICTED: protein charlatan isoform X2 [Vollenhovia emeryi]|uniref:protein charlatan isoform X2 n=1 Tax=Vollenhovia emeryi TaxID=411798 RepID=UPI0005F4A199|nr:PREDICTED: protein charlatan isoform X2 [Vollenhovia emeryi]